MKNNLLINVNSKAASGNRSGFVFLSVAILFVCITFQTTSYAQKPTALIYHKDSLKADLIDLKETLYSAHENPFYYVDSLTFEKEFTDTYEGITENISLADFATRVSQLLQTLKDSHTGVSTLSLFNYLKADTALVLNFRTLSLNNEMVIFGDKTETIPDGATLLFINSIPVDSITHKARKFQFLEGNSQEQSEMLSSSLTTRIFDLYYGVQENNKIEYEFNGTLYTKNYAATTYKEIKKSRKKSSYSPFQLKIAGDVAKLRIGSFSYGNDGKYYRFLSKSFKKIKKEGCSTVVIDLRNNLGGNVWRMEHLYSYLAGDSILVPESVIHQKSDLSNIKYQRLTKGIFGWARMNMFKKNDKMRVFQETARLPIGERDTLIYKQYSTKNKHAFEGNKALFMNHSSASASVLFASIFKQKNYGVIIGTPCLGPMGGTWGDPTPYTLKRSKLNLLISVLRLNTTLNYDTSPESISPDVLYPLKKEHIQTKKVDEMFDDFKKNIPIYY